MRKIAISFALLVGAAFAQTGQCHLGSNAGNSCTLDSNCPGAGAYCARLAHIVFIIKENRSFDQYFRNFPGVTTPPSLTYPCVGTTQGCVSGSKAVFAQDPTLSDPDCGHQHQHALTDLNGGAMNKFNQTCGAAGWVNVYGKVCSDYKTSHQACSVNADCTNNDCSGNSLPHYWAYAAAYGLADHFFSSIMGPSYPAHAYIFAADANESSDNPSMTNGHAPNGTNGNTWSCDSFHFGRCSNAASTLCSVNGDCSGGGTCNINQPTGKCYVSTATSCTTNADCPANDYCANGNVYTGTTVTMKDLDLAGGTGNAYVPGVCTADNTKACHCSTTFAGYSVTNPCTDTTSTCAGVSNNCDPTKNIGSTLGAACPNVVTIADRLDAASVTWKQYTANGGELWNPVSYFAHLRYGSDWTNNVSTSDSQFISDATACVSDASCPLPSVVWLNTGQGNGGFSEHPADTVEAGESWTNARVVACMTNDYCWKHSAIFIFHDDWGGFYDHIAPSQNATSWNNGIRVPAICVGRYCKNTVVTTVFTYESALKCVEVQYGLSALNSRDSAANDLCTSTGGMIDLSLNNAPLGSVTVGASQSQKGTKMSLGTSVQ